MSYIASNLSAIEEGDAQAAKQFLTLVYRTVRQVTAAKMAQKAPGQTPRAQAARGTQDLAREPGKRAGPSKTGT